MTRDYKHSRTKTSKPLPGWVWFFSGFAMGLIVAFIVYLNGQQALKEIRETAFGSIEKANVKPAEVATQTEPEAPPKRRFDFYTLLPELEVVVPEENSPSPTQRSVETPRKTSIAKPATSGYLLQVGSFRKVEEADSLKAKLALLGVESTIKSVRVSSGTWHRVRVGPYQDRERLNRIRARLQKNNVNSMLLLARE